MMYGEEGELIEDLFESLVLSRRETSDFGCRSSKNFEPFQCLFNELVEYSLYSITSSLPV